MSKNNMKVGVGEYSIILNEEIMHRLSMLKDCGYMINDISKVIDAVIEIYNSSETYGEIIPAIDGMALISTLHEAQKDYAFLSSLVVEKQPLSVLVESSQYD